MEQRSEYIVAVAIVVSTLAAIFLLPQGVGSSQILWGTDYISLIVKFVAPLLLFGLVAALIGIAGIAGVRLPVLLGALAVGGLTVPLILGFRSGTILSAVFFLGAGFIFARNAEREATSRVKILVGRSVSAAVGVFFTAMIFAATINFYFGYTAEIQRDGFALPQSLLLFATNFVTSNLGDLGCKGSDTFNQCVGKLTDGQVAELTSTYTQQCGGNQVCLQQAQTVLQQQRTQLITANTQKLLNQFGVNATGTETINGILAKAIGEQTKKILVPYAKYVPILGAVTVFSILNALTYPMSAVVSTFADLLFNVMVASSLIKLKVVKKDVEVIE